MDDFFKILASTESAEGTWTYTLSINPDHDIFRGHFPGRPVVPGVMTLMMTRKCAEQAKGLGATRIGAIKEAKYIIEPEHRYSLESVNLYDTEGNAVARYIK